MDENTQDELAFFDMLNAREAALIAATGALTVDNVPTDRLRRIERATTNEIIRLAARTVLYNRR